MGHRRCCCACELLIDAFERVGATAADGVNRPDVEPDYFDFEPGDYEIATATAGFGSGGVLLCNVAVPIHFLPGVPASVEISARIEDGMTATLSSGGHYHTVTGTEVDVGGGDMRIQLAHDFDGDVFTESLDSLPSGSVRTVTLLLLFARPYNNTELLYSHYPPFTEGMIRGPQCRDKALDVSAETWDWSLTGSPGVEFDQLEAVRIQYDCTTFATTCQHTCAENNPATLEVTIGGMTDTMGDCEDGSRTDCRADCDTAYDACLAASAAAELGCEGDCDCATAKKTCDCGCNNDHTIEVRQCPAIADGTYVLNRVGDVLDKCGPCFYRGVVPLESLWDGTADEEGSCNNNVAVETEFTAELTTVGYDGGAMRRIVRVDVYAGLHKTDGTAITWSTGDVSAELFCTGETLELTASETLYADACRLAYRAESGAEGSSLTEVCDHAPGPVGPECGADLECDDGMTITPCGDTIEVNPEITRPAHDEITLDDLEAV